MIRKNIFSSIRWRFVIIYLLVSCAILGMVTLTVFSMVENHVVSGRINQETTEVNKVSARVSSYIETSDANALYEILYDSGSQNGGRWLVLNNSGIVIADSFSTLNGIKLDNKEVNDIIFNNKSFSYGYHDLSDGYAGDNWCVYYASVIRSGGESIGVLFFSSSIQDIMNTLDAMRYNFIWIFVFSLVAIVIAGIFSTNVIIKPLKDLSFAASKISSGDLSQRVNVKGHNEISEFSNTFNMMCDKIQDVDKQRSEFVSNASHELKTPVASMKILVESLLYQDDVDPKYYKEFLTDINGELDRMNNLVNDLLLLTRMDSDTVVLSVDEVSVMQIIKECITSLKPIADKSGITFSLSGLSDVIAECDRIKISQVLYNLIGNAVKYSKSGGHVDVALSKVGNNVHVAVSDDGVGISKEDLPLIFDRFYRVDKARSRETGGSGLGLHIVRKIALMHNGRIEVTSEKGKGSCFTLVLPLMYQRKKDNTKDGVKEDTN